ncbi:MAG: divalent-cation tolerance protein CutA [Acidobacteria bacterium]|nr:divalent-cation tolerance protein CutA [Acidobacteriota bacterium]
MAACEVVVVLITCPEDDHVALASSLVDERLAACVHVLPAGDSIYRWGGAVERARERQLIVKTTTQQVSRLRDRVQELHPYETPEFLCLPVSGGDDRYVAWVHAMVGRTETGDDAPPSDVTPGD